MRFAVYGTGGVGGYLGGRLARAGEDVIFIARGDHLAALNADGLRVESTLGDFHVQPVAATDDPRAVGIVDVVLVGVKAWQVTAIAADIAPMLGPDSCVVPLQNGIEAPGQLAAVLGTDAIVGGTCRIVSYIAAPGRIRHVGAEPLVQVGELDKRPSPRLERLQQAFAGAGLHLEIVANIEAALWMKYLLITPWSGLGAITRASIGVWRSVPETRRLAEQAIDEVLAVASARGVSLPADANARTLAVLDNVAADATASMQRDIMAGRPSELDALLGALVRMGVAAGVAVPLHTFLFSSLLPQELRAWGELHVPN